MESSLHRQLKAEYAGPQARQEVRLGRWRIDAVVDERLIEVQHASLAAIRDKIQSLLAEHSVLVVKPIVARRRIVKLASLEGPVRERRLSPKQGTLLELFQELVHFTRVFPHPRLCLEVLLVETEEHRYPGHGRRRRWRKSDYEVADERLLAIRSRLRLERAEDLLQLLPQRPPRTFDSAQLAAAIDRPRWVAQQVAYCLRNMGAAREVGKRGNTRLYELTSAA